ncbi:hypothetical protein NQ318_019101 [Aromia moschata]|uniref:DUF5641 domain-containing protein n=1 Tax=Aromia moschata TaxID=1265417 RepID=A0AAV8XS88_9CUCU|nr:hypothetical protein NQ318_019101 [Aromia moschata]
MNAESFIRKRASIKARLTHFETYLSSFTTDDENISSVQAVELEQRVIRLENLINEFDDIQANIESVAENMDKEFDERETIDSRFYSALLVNNHVMGLFNVQPVDRESSVKIRNLIDSFTKHIRSLSQLKQPTEHWDTLLIFILTGKLDPVTAREWENHRSGTDLPTLHQLSQFLKNRADFLETLETNHMGKRASNDQIKPKSRSHGFHTQTVTCPMCESNHFLYRCREFSKMSNNQRAKKVKDLNLCENCLHAGHKADACKYGSCKKCQLKHNTLIHVESSVMTTPNTSNTNSLSACSVKNAYILLSTALLAINDSQGNGHLVVALLDSGSQSSFITRRLCKKLGLKTNKVNLTVSGIGSVTSNVTHRCNTTVKSRDGTFRKNVALFVLPLISGTLPNVKIDISHLNIAPNISLANPNFHQPSEIYILLGADVFWELILPEQISLGTNKPKLQKTAFSWVVSGPINVNGRQNTVSCNLNTKFELHDQLTRFWEIEESSSKKLMSNEEIACEAHFSETFRRNNDGRFIVSLPLKHPVEFLGESRTQAERRAANIIRSDFYVDDLLSGADTREEAIELCKQISECLQGGCFNLRKWRSNDPSILQNVQSQTNETALDFGTQIFFSFSRISKFNRMIRTAAYVLRFVHNIKNANNARHTGELTVSELDIALKFLVKLSQCESFPAERSNLYEKRPLKSDSKILSLAPFMDTEGIIRVGDGGRLLNSNFAYDKKLPMLLSPSHRFTELLFREEHIRLLHAGPQLLLANSRERFLDYCRMQQFLQHIWQRWSKEYVTELQQRQRWKSSSGQLRVDDLVLIKDNNVPSFKWRLGRVTVVYPGIIPVKRAFSKICPLPIVDI